MAGEIQVVYTTGLNLYAVVHRANSDPWNTSGSPAFESYTQGHWANYAVALTEQGNSGFYYGDFPSGIAVKGNYQLDLRQRLGGSAAYTDPSLGIATFSWNGASEASPAATQLDLTQAIPNSVTTGTVGDALQAAEVQGFGKWVQSGTTLTLYRHDGTTVARTLTLDSATTPTQRS